MSDNSRVRVSIVGVVIVALFSSLVARLWFLQMGPEQKLRAQALGYVGEIDSAQLKLLKSRGYQAGALIGRDGIEAAYESVLRGVPEVETVQVDPTGKQVGPGTVVQPGSVGNDLTLTIDADLQRAAELALQAGILAARTHQDKSPAVTAKGFSLLKAPAGAVLVLDVRDGSVRAMASFPAFSPGR